MVDYLEESLERTEALLEEVQRLERGLSGLKEEKMGEAVESSSGAEAEKTETGREDGAETAQTGTGPLLENIPSLPLLYEQGHPNREPGKAGDLEVPERILTPLEEQENQTGSLERAEALEVPERVLTPLEVQGDLTGGKEARAPEGAERSETPALLHQIEQLERAAVSAGDMSFRRQVGAEASRGYPVSLPGPGTTVLPGVTTAVSLGQSASFSGTFSADDTRWAERADRVFRRDSRRYDGGFYLY